MISIFVYISSKKKMNENIVIDNVLMNKIYKNIGNLTILCSCFKINLLFIIYLLI